MTSIRCIDYTFNKQGRSNLMNAARETALRHRAAPGLAAQSSLYLVPKIEMPHRREARKKSRAFRRGGRLKFADGMFVALALGGAAAMWWSVW